MARYKIKIIAESQDTIEITVRAGKVSLGMDAILIEGIDKDAPLVLGLTKGICDVKVEKIK